MIIYRVDAAKGVYPLLLKVLNYTVIKEVFIEINVRTAPPPFTIAAVFIPRRSGTPANII